MELELDNKRSESFLVESLNALDKWALKEDKILYLVFDEAQLLRHFKRNSGLDFNEFFSYIYENLSGLRIILTGSEVGLLEEFIGLDDSSSPLYGRYVKKLYLSRFARKESEEFIRIGFEEVEMEASEDIIREAVNTLDGIVGWLVFFGRVCIDAGRVDKRSIALTLEKAEIIVNDEFSNLKRNSSRYISVLKAMAFGSVILVGDGLWRSGPRFAWKRPSIGFKFGEFACLETRHLQLLMKTIFCFLLT